MSCREKVTASVFHRQAAECLVDFSLRARSVSVERIQLIQDDHRLVPKLIGRYVDHECLTFRSQDIDPVVSAQFAACVETTSRGRASSSNACCSAAEATQEQDADQRCVKT